MSEYQSGFASHEASAKFGVKEFHKAAGRLDDIVQREKEEERFRDPETGILKESLAKYRKCPVCDKEEHEVSFLKQGFSYCLCNYCHMLYVNPILNNEVNNENYSNCKFEDQSLNQFLNPLNRQFDEPKFLKALDILEKQLPETQRRVLDIGSAAGHFLELAKNRNWNVTGIELGHKAAEYTRSLGIDVVEKPLEKSLFPKNYFDLVSMWDLFEHLPNPNETLQTIRNILSENGLIAMIVPNANALAAKIMRERCNMFIGSKHLNIFNKETLSIMFENHNFEVIHMESLIGEINAINNYLNYQHPYMGNIPPSNNILGLIDDKTIHKNFMGYKLFCIAQKKK